jgi:hypothetical protein
VSNRQLSRSEGRANRQQDRGDRRWPGRPFLRRRVGQTGPRRHVFEKRELPGGLSTYGIIALREPVDVALEEARMIERVGRQIKTGIELGKDVSLAQLQSEFDALC